MRFDSYQTQGFRDEMFDDAGVVRPEARLLLDTIESLEDGQLLQCQQAAERLLLQMGITFNVYGDSAGAERIFPFDLIPRIVRAEEWAWIERTQTAHSRAQRVYRRHLPRPENPERQDHSGRGHLFGHFLPPAVRRHQSAAADLVPHYRHRPGAPRGRQYLRAGR